ncbi:PREDICTED: cubilin-like [Nicrophorus vespilloides]|uniref:Cubilin-like n=1 Tax=Nicrophorus vespilloides TaxID=110193 RepID=A0ABM1N856_NICVS|nr:PREDICTED: cubilin-like [Nicrophorus vespilloides]
MVIDYQVGVFVPFIEVSSGNLVFHGSHNKDVVLETTGLGRVMLNNMDLTIMMNSMDTSIKGMDQVKADISTVQNAVQRFELSLYGKSGILKRMEIVEASNTTNGRNYTILFTVFRRRLVGLQRKLRVLNNLLIVNECSSNPCLNGGTCVDMFNSYMCRCVDQWEGPNCDVDVNECKWFAGTDLGCQNGATCVNTKGSYECNCADGWFGLHCTKRSQDCSSNSEICGHGTCVSQSTGIGFKCICDQGWKTDGTKPACTVDVNECENYQPPCSINPPVKCVNLPGTFYCGHCPNGYTGNGFYCTDIDECALFNGGCSLNPMVQCINTLGSKNCGPCPPGYIGNGMTCSYQGGVCGVNNGGCSPLAQCRDNSRISSTYVECICPKSYSGNGFGPDGCTKNPAGPCASNPCQHGSCSTGPDGGYVCLCNRQYTGNNCSIRKNPCDSSPCKNGGECVSLTVAHICICKPPYGGKNCDNELQECGRKIGVSGFIEYPMTNATRTNSFSCAWVIETQSSMVLNITFSKFQMSQCASNWLQINDGSNSASHLIGRYCDESPNTFVTTSNTVYIWFRHIRGARPKFKLGWNSILPVCGDSITVTSHGSFKSPGAPGVYPPNRDCYWSFTAPFGKRIQFHFFSLLIGYNKDCSNDYLEFREGLKPSDPLLVQYCNTSHPEPLISPGHEVVAHFHSDEKGSFPGFQISYSIVDGISGCGGIYTTPEGIINSPATNGKYPVNSFCEYKIKLVGSAKILLNFNEFSLEQSVNCDFDSLTIYSGSSIDAPLVGKYCGKTKPAPLMTYGSEVMLVFKSDWSHQETGFSIKYETVCGGQYIDPNGTIYSENFGTNVTSDKSRECIYNIMRPSGNYIRLDFLNINFAGANKDCTTGYIEVRDGDNENSTLIGRFCESIPSTKYSTYNYVWIKYVASAGILNEFYINYTSISNNGCGGIFKNKVGSIESPDDLDSYTDGLTCSWLLVAPEDYVIQLTWVKFNLEQSYNCIYDKVTIMDQGTEPVSTIGTYCGNKLPPTLISSSNLVKIKFEIDNSKNLEGFLFTYTFIHERNMCGGQYFTSSGVIKSPYYPEHYPSNRDCTWIVTVPAGQQVMLNVTFFEIEQFPNCRYDYLEIRNGGTAAAPLIGTYCGTNIPKIIPSHANQMYMRFKSDTTKKGPGFLIAWSSTSTGCGGSLTSPMGTIISPQYPEPYHKNTECFWKISISAGSVVQIVFADLDLEPHVTCVLDYVEIFDGIGTNAKSLGKYCTSHIKMPAYIRSTSNHMTIKFRSDLSFQGRGFQIKYTTICSHVITGFNGVIESPGYPNTYESKQHCTWEIGVPDGNKINMTFSQFELGPSLWNDKNCSKNDFLEIKYQDEETLTSYGSYCGNNTPSDIAISSNKSLVILNVDHAMYNSRFRLEWHIDGCGGLLTHPTGVITTPNYPNGYVYDTRCDWLIQVDYGYSVQFTIKDIDLERSDKCEYDYITFYNGVDDNYPAITKICYIGHNPLTITSTGNSMFVRFQSDSSYNGKGFSAEYSTIASKCGGKLTASHGNLHSPNYPLNYDKNDSCTWLIEIEENHVIELEFKDFDLVNLCDRNYLKIYDGPTPAYPLLAKLCANKKPNGTLTSRTNHLYIEMITNPYLTSKGFLASYKTACGAEITTQGGGLIQFAKNNQFFMDLTEYEHCNWTIRATNPSDHIYITIVHMESDQCYLYDGLSIYDGENNNSTLIGHYCGNQIPPRIKSSGSTLHLEIDNMDQAFTARYSVLDTHCGGTLESQTGLFGSPNYPDNYPVDIQCEWILKTSPGNRIMVAFTEFALAPSDNCNEDYVEIREIDGKGKLLGLFCGNNIPTNITASENIWIYFKSDKPLSGEAQTTAKGFLAQYTLVHGNTLEGPNGTVTSPMYPRLYFQNGEFSWKITVKPGYQIALTFTDFNLEYFDNDGCYVTFLTIYDGSDSNSPEIGTYCGFTAPEDIKSTKNVIFININFDIIRKGSRFSLNWQEIRETESKLPTVKKINTDGCGSDDPIALSDNERFNITSPDYPNMYSHPLTCTWLFSTTPDKHLAIRLNTLDLHTSGNCEYGDSISIFTGGIGLLTYRLVEKLCHQNETGQLISTSKLMKVVFKAKTFTNQQRYTGFSGYVAAVCGGSVKSPTGIIKVDNVTEFVVDSIVECVWHVEARPGKTIRIEFSDFHLGEDSTSCKNYILFKNGQYSSSPNLGNGKYCGNEKPPILETTGNYLYIKYFSLSTLTNFKLRYSERSINCGGKIILSSLDNSTVISSPNYPNIPSPHIECIWTIVAPPGESIRIDFLRRFDFRSNKGCTLESVEIRNGGTHLSPLIGIFCDELPSTHVSLENMMYIKFTTDIDEPSNGFQAQVSVAGCGGIIRGSSGEIKSPGYNNRKMYMYKADCKWEFIGPNDHYLDLKFETIDLPFSLTTDCNKVDHVTITEYNKINRTEEVIGNYCGRTPPTGIRSKSNLVYIYFKSDGVKKMYNGFKLSFNCSQSKCGGEFNSESGVLISPGYPYMNHNNRNCEWTIRVPKGRRVRVDIEDVDFDKTVAFFTQGVAFFNGIGFSSPLQYIKAKDVVPNVIRSSDNTMKVFFWSGQPSNHRGFKARFSSDEPTICLGDLNQDSGVIRTPNISVHTCTWDREPKVNKPHETIALSIDTFSVNSTACTYGLNTITVILGHDKLNPIEICRTPSHSLIIRSPLPKLKIHTRRPPLEILNYTISYQTYPCGGEFTHGFGTVQSPNFPNKSINKSECAWILSGSKDQSLTINFQTFDLDPDCDKNYLIIYNGPNAKSPRIGKFCSTKNPGSIRSQGNTLLLEYHIEKNSKGTGFNASYEPIVKGCGGILQTSTIITSPQYPKDYPNNAECLWELRSKPGYHINLEFFDRFQIETSDNCDKDYVKIYNKMEQINNTDIAKYCGRNIPPSFNAFGNTLFVLFRSNAATTGTGFKAKWNLKCGGTFEADNKIRYITSPGYPEGYGNELNCQYTIKATGKYIEVEFEDFDIEKPGGFGCIFDNVTILSNRDTKRANNKLTFCGTNKPTKIKLLDSVTITFITDKWLTKRGFKLSYMVDSCGGNITEPTIIQKVSEKGSNLWMIQGVTLCTWTVTAPLKQRVSLKFLTIDLMHSINCGIQYIMVYDSKWNKLAKLCGHLDGELPVIHSNDNKMIIKYSYTSFLSRTTNFSAAIYFTHGPDNGCGGSIVLNNSSTTINTPTHLDDFDCIWKFAATRDYTIKIELLEMHATPCAVSTKEIEANNNNCSCILYELRDGYTSTSEHIDTVCNGEISTTSTYYTSTASAWMRIASHQKATKASKIRFTAIPSICGNMHLTARSTPQYVTTPNYPNEYPKNIRCVWRISSAFYTQRIQMRFVEFDLNNKMNAVDFISNTCDTLDRLEVVDSTNKAFHLDYDMIFTKKPSLFLLSSYNVMLGSNKFCSTNDTNYEYLSQTNKIQLNFYSNNMIKNGKGFKLEYAIADCNRNYTTLQGRLNKNWYVGNCSIYITVPENYTISLYFTLFSTFFSDCSMNGLQIYDGDETKTKLLDVCMTAVPSPVFSNGNQLYLKMYGTAKYGVNTFDITYTSSNEGRGCGGNLYNFKGSFSSPMYPNVYNHNGECTWNVKVPLGLQVAMKFSTFDIGGTCDSNYVIVTTYVGKLANERKFCKGDNIGTIISTGIINVYYKTTTGLTGTGWFAKFLAITSDITEKSFESSSSSQNAGVRIRY